MRRAVNVKGYRCQVRLSPGYSRSRPLALYVQAPAFVPEVARLSVDLA